MKKILVLILIVLATAILGFIIFYNTGLSSVSKDKTDIEFMVESGSTYYSIAHKLKENKLIRNELCFKLYVKFNKTEKLNAGKYVLNRSMNVEQIVKTLSKGNSYNPDAIVITFKEGKNMRYIASMIESNTNNTIDDVYKLLKDEEYLNSLIDKYWFIDDSILNKDLYYSLEGYLYPNTYQFQNKDVSVKEIFETMLDEMDLRLSEYKTDLLNSKYSIHEILTLASIVELEGGKNTDREGIAGVFYNRLNKGYSLGSDVTTYYAAKIELSDRDLYKYEVDDKNNYNTRSDYLAGKLPIGPISNPSIDSINACLHPKNSDYFYFVADKNGNTYFSKTYEEHLQIKNELIEANLWYTYD